MLHWVLSIPGRSLAADLGRVALLEDQRAAFSLAGLVGGVARSAWRDAEFLLAELAAFLLLLLRDLRHLGGWEGASEGGIKMAGVETGEASLVGRRDAVARGQRPNSGDSHKKVG